MRRGEPIFQKVLPNEVPVTLSIEKVFTKDASDDVFHLECRICSGEFTGDMISLWFYRKRKDGGERQDTRKLLQALVPGKDPAEIKSWMIHGKIFETTPWKPEASRYQMYGLFRLVGENEYKS